MILELVSFLHLTVVDILDILAVAFILYYIYRWLHGSSAMNIFIAIILLLIVRVVAVALNMKMLSAILRSFIDVGAIALVVIFQPEIRQFLSRMGRGGWARKKGSIMDRILKRKDETLHAEDVLELADACAEMSADKTGALIVMLHKDALNGIIDTGDTLDADIRKRLIENIFFKNSPLHDGAMIIGNGRIAAARCTLPVTERQDIPARYGMRHKAAVGLSEICDADVIVVSEQTGKISFVSDGTIYPVSDKNELVKLLEGGTERNK